MNQIRVNTAELETKVRNAAKACAKNPLAGNAVELSARNGMLTVYGGSTLMTVKNSLPYEGEANFTIVVGSDILLNAISKMKALSDTLTIIEDEQVRLECGYAKVNLSTLANIIITKRGEDETYEECTTVTGLGSMVAQTAHALASDGQGNPKMSVFQVKLGVDGGIMVTALDGHRISSRTTTANVNGGKELLVYGKPLQTIMQMIDNNSEIKLSFPKTGMFIKIDGPDIEATVSVLRGEYYNLSEMLNMDDQISITFEKGKVLEALGLVSLFGKKTKIMVDSGQMIFNSIAEAGNNEGDSQFIVPYEGEIRPITIGVSNAYLTEALKTIEGSKVNFTLSTSRAPMQLSDRAGVLEVILPVVIN